MTSSLYHVCLMRRHRNHCARQSVKARGYVLLFVLGVIAVAATLVLSLSVGVRLDTQLFSHERRAVQDEYLLRGAAQYTAMQLGITAAVDALHLDPKSDAARSWQLWRATSSHYEMVLDTVKFSVKLEDASDFPDANLMSAIQWQRLLQMSGVAPAQAGRTAETIVALRQELAKARGSAGFASLDELMGWKEIPAEIRELVVVGTKAMDVDLNSTPVQVLEFLGDVPPPKLQQLKVLREAGPIPQAQAQAWIAGTGLLARQPTSALRAVKARITMETSPLRPPSVWTALISSENGGYVVVDQLRGG